MLKERNIKVKNRSLKAQHQRMIRDSIKYLNPSKARLKRSLIIGEVLIAISIPVILLSRITGITLGLVGILQTLLAKIMMEKKKTIFK